MFDSAILELVIGLVFIFSLMSILVTQINTLVTNALNLRAKNLKESLLDLVGDKQLQAEILVHPLIKLIDPAHLTLVSLTMSVEEDGNKAQAAAMENEMANLVLNAPLTRVVDIPANTFVDALVGILTVRAFGPLERAIHSLRDPIVKDRFLALLADFRTDPSEERFAALRQQINNLPGEESDVTFVRASFDKLQTIFAEIHTRSPDLVPLLIGISRIKTTPFREAMQVILYSAQSLTDATLKLQTWFNDAMARSSAKFRESLQKISLYVGLAVVVFMNVDTLAITQELWEDPQLRASIAVIAGERVAEPAVIVPDTDDPTVPPLTTSVIEDARNAQQTAQQLLSLRVPLGWRYVALTPEMQVEAAALGLPDPYGDPSNVWNLWPGNPNPSWFTLLLAKIVGLAASAIAAAQGAPFWFDLLQRITGRKQSS